MNKNNKCVLAHEVNKIHNGKQIKWQFTNGYGASVISHDHSYGGRSGLWEMALLKNDNLYYLGENAEIFSDVHGHLNDPEVDKFLQMIAGWDKDQY